MLSRRTLTTVVIAGMISVATSASIATAAPAKVTLIAPSGSTSSASPTFSWSSDSEATYYLLRVIDWTGTTIDRWYTPATADCTASCAAALGVMPGPITWGVLAWSPAGYGPWSEMATFMTDVQDATAGVPQPLAPTGTLWLSNNTFTWTGTSNAVLYHFSITVGTSTNEYWWTPSQLNCVGATQSCGMLLSMISQGVGQWKVQAWTANGHGDWSAIVDISFASIQVPQRPTGTAPIGSAGPSPTFTWNASNDVVYYYVVVDDVTGNRVDRWLTPAQVGCTSGGTCSFTPAVALTAGTAQWRVLAWNPRGYSPWSSTLTFNVSGSSTLTEQVPGKLVLLAPAGAIATLTPTFTWNAEAHSTYYLLRVTDWTGTIIDRWYTPSSAGCSSGSGVCSATLNVSLTPGPLGWKMLGWSPAGYGSWNQEVSFLADVADLAVPAPLPVGPSGTLWSLTPTYTWERVSDSVLYRFSISNNGLPFVDSWYTPSALNCVSAAAQCAFTSQVTSNGSAQWKVQAWTINGHGTSSGTTSVTFAVFPAPRTPSPLAPIGTSGTSPTFSWTASDNVVYYYVRADDVTGNRVDRWLTPAQLGCTSGGTCAFSPGVVLNLGSAQWKVLAWNPSGYSQWSNTVSFAVQ